MLLFANTDTGLTWSNMKTVSFFSNIKECLNGSLNADAAKPQITQKFYKFEAQNLKTLSVSL
jgi:hypothetical protein